LLSRLCSEAILALLLINALIFTFDIHIAKLEPSTITVPDDYPSIQEAINNADNGDTIFVKNGTYHESIIVNKTVSIIGESKETTVFNASGFYDGILITSDNVTVREFTIQDATWRGIRIKSSRCCISDSNIIENNEGIFLDGREPGVTVRDNAIIDNIILRSSDMGISLWASCHNHIIHNIVKDSDYGGIFLHSNASNNAIKRNVIRNNGDVGILLNLDCSYNTLTSNNISYNGFQSFAWWSGVVLNTQCNGNQILGNKICDNKRGFFQRVLDTLTILGYPSAFARWIPVAEKNNILIFVENPLSPFAKVKRIDLKDIITFDERNYLEKLCAQKLPIKNIHKYDLMEKCIRRFLVLFTASTITRYRPQICSDILAGEGEYESSILTEVRGHMTPILTSLTIYIIF